MPRPRKPKKGGKSAIEAALAAPAKLILPEPEEIDPNEPPEAEELRQASALAQFRHKHLGTPLDLKGDAAEKWADSQLTELLPLAVAELKDTLMHSGSRKERMEAAKQVLDSTGRGKSERAVQNTPAIVINLGGGANLTPWRTINGEVQRESTSDGRAVGDGSAQSGGPGGVPGAP